MQCSYETSQLTYLKVTNVKNLVFAPDRYTQSPPKMYFENITWIEEIPYNTFNQISRRWTTGICFIPSYDLESVILKKVNIGTIKSEAFFHLEELTELTFNNVNIQKIEADGIHVTMDAAGKFLSHNTMYRKLDQNSIYISGRKMISSTNDFVEFLQFPIRLYAFKAEDLM